MATVSILSTIDKIIERANEVKVFQDHTRLIISSLTRLRHRFNVPDETRLQEDLLEILETINGIVTSCAKGMTYKDLETTLLRLQYRLAQYQCNSTDLSNVLGEQQLCVSKPFDETWKQKLDTFEQQIKENIAEKHCYLREKYSKTIESYLRNQIPSKEQSCQIRFKADKSMPFARKKLRRLLTEDEGEFIRNKRWSIILGDPGSGKTNFVQWITYYLSQTLLKREYSTQYGPVRIPILISIDKFVEVWKEEPSITLFDYIGKHIDVSCALQDYIQQGQALIILDGLDQCSQINHIIDKFVDTYVQTPLEESSLFDNVFLNNLFDDPFRFGGNQIIVTSRIGDYPTVPLTNKFSCYIIQPLDKKSLMDILKIESETTQNMGLLEMASNPRLLSYICTLSLTQTLPPQRILQYESIITTMLSSCPRKLSTTEISQVIRILTDMTSYIHQNSTSNLIHRDTIKEICIQTIKGTTRSDQLERQASEMFHIICDNVGILTLREPSYYSFLHLAFEEYFTCLKLLEADRSVKQKFVVDGSNQEKKIEIITQMLCRHTSDQRFRVPIALALGKVSSSWSTGSFDDLCYEFIQTKHEYDSFLPYHCYILIHSMDDLVNYPSNEILFNALVSLIISAGQHQWSIVSPFLIDQMTNVLRKLPKETISSWINQFLSQYCSDNIQTLTAFCQVIEGKCDQFENIQWLDERSCSILQSLSKFDCESNGFGIDRLLVQISFSNPHLFPSNPTTLRGFLITNQIEMNSIPVVLLPLIICLYGGLTRDGQNIIFNPSHIHRESSVLTPILIQFLSSNDQQKQDQNLNKFHQECLKSFLIRIENDDQSFETIDLCIATICLYNIEYIQTNLKMISNSLLRLCLDRLKYISQILRQFYFVNDQNDRTIENEITNFISMSIDKFGSVESSRFAFLAMLNTLKSSVARLRSSSTSIFFQGLAKSDQRVTLFLPNSLKTFLNGLLITDIQFHSNDKSCSFIDHFTGQDNLHSLAATLKNECSLSLLFGLIRTRVFISQLSTSG